MCSRGVPENPKDKEWNLCEYRRTLIIRNGIRGSTGEPEGQGIEYKEVPENTKDKEWTPCEYRRKLMIMHVFRESI